jgi:hypothetical protein
MSLPEGAGPSNALRWYPPGRGADSRGGDTVLAAAVTHHDRGVRLAGPAVS